MFDVIGDIHGCADELEELLRLLGYKKRNGTYEHPKRQAIFLGDLIDRGPQQAATLQLVRPMIDSGRAYSVLGNHEFNAICYSTQIDSKFVRPHSEKNTKQHAAFLREFPFGSDRHHAAIEWFRTLPLYLDLPAIGIVHACWCEQSFADLESTLAPGQRLSPETIEQYSQQGSAIYEAIERILKGPEQQLPDALRFKDKDGHLRSHARLRWWKSADHAISERLEFGGTQLSVDELSLLDQLEPIAAHSLPNKPVFVGHYWQQGKPAPLSENVACVDYSVANGGRLTAYRWDGERKIEPEKFAWVSALPSARA